MWALSPQLRWYLFGKFSLGLLIQKLKPFENKFLREFSIFSITQPIEDDN